MDKPKLNSGVPWHQGYYNPLNPHKVIGDPTKIIYRSQWEREFLKWCDLNPKVLRYASEECVIRYKSPIDGKEHKYFLDFYIETKLSDGNIKHFLVEIKPYNQTKQPVISKKRLTEKQKEKYKKDWQTYIINRSKWDAARKYCEQRKWQFVILTENELFRTKK